MESDLPTPIDDSLPFCPRENIVTEEEEVPRHHQQYYYVPQPAPSSFEYFEPPPQQQQKKSTRGGDIFAELDKIHWIIFLSAVLLAFFMGKSISTPIIIKSM